MMLDVNGLSHAYGRHKALDEVSVRLRGGEAVAILGANGAGKTTLLNAIAGLIRPWEARFASGQGARRVSRPTASSSSASHRAGKPAPVRADVGDREPQSRRLHRRARAGGRSTLERIFDLFPRLAERRGQTVRTMSGGERQMVAIGRALMTQPRLLLLDEPSLGLSPRLSGELFAVLARIAGEGEVSILMVEQNARRALTLAERAYLLALGRIVGEGEADKLADDSAVARSYLGL